MRTLVSLVLGEILDGVRTRLILYPFLRPAHSNTMTERNGYNNAVPKQQCPVVAGWSHFRVSLKLIIQGAGILPIGRMIARKCLKVFRWRSVIGPGQGPG